MESEARDNSTGTLRQVDGQTRETRGPRRNRSSRSALVSMMLMLLGIWDHPSGLHADEYLDLAGAKDSRCGWGTAGQNRSVDGRPLRIGATEFQQGIGTHAPAEITYELKGDARWLTFHTGISAAMTEKGSAVVEVWLDGKKSFETGVLRVGEPAQYVCLPLTGTKHLRFVVTDAGDGMAADHVNLCQLRLAYSAAKPRPDGPVEEQVTGLRSAPGKQMALWYSTPARRWLDALPVGNGRLGAMVFGGVHTERLALNESTFWSGAPGTEHENPTALAHLGEIRQLLFNHEFRKAQELMNRHLLGRPLNYGTHLPVGDLLLTMIHPEQEVVDYQRELDLDRAVARTTYKIGRTRFQREVFASHADSVVIMRFTASGSGNISFKTGFKPNNPTASVTPLGNNTLVINADARESKHSDGKSGVSLVGQVRIVPVGGKLRAGRNHIEVEEAKEVLIVVALNTNFRGRNPSVETESQIKAVAGQSPDRLLRRHLEDYQPLFRRVSLDLGGWESGGSPTDVRLKRLRDGGEDQALAALFFQYGRYLLIAGSREDSPLPTNLQGIWNDNLACNMGWTCDFHLDINTQQNYWPAEVTNLSECHEPLFRLIEGLREPGRRTARVVYGARGWVCHVFTNPWGFTAPGGSLGWGLHPTGGIWIASHLWEHFLFTRDLEFLRSRAYPVLREAADFFLDSMVTDPKTGWLVTGPSTSPENSFVTPNGQGHSSEYMGPTCDIVLVRDLFRSCIESSRMLGIDEEFRSRLVEAEGKLPPLRAGRHGQLMEWLEDFEEAAPNHRHTTHLIALHPGSQIDRRRTPDLAQAARTTLERKLGRKDWEDVEWSRGNLINYFARLGDGEEAHRQLLGLMRWATDSDLLTYSRAGVAGANDNIFCVDGNSAGTAGIAEMLLQSHGDEIELLPAVPKAWSEGRVRGLKARGNVTVDFDWKNGRVLNFKLDSTDRRKVRVRVDGVVREVTTGTKSQAELRR